VSNHVNGKYAAVKIVAVKLFDQLNQIRMFQTPQNVQLATHFAESDAVVDAVLEHGFDRQLTTAARPARTHTAPYARMHARTCDINWR